MRRLLIAALGGFVGLLMLRWGYNGLFGLFALLALAVNVILNLLLVPPLGIVGGQDFIVGRVAP